MAAWLALVAALGLAPPATSTPGPQGPAPASPSAATGSAATTSRPEGPRPAPASPAVPAARPPEEVEAEGNERAEPPGGVPKIPSPRSLRTYGTGTIKPVSEDTLGSLGLTRQRDGTMMYVDAGKRFTAVFNADGTVRFGDRWNRDQHGNKLKGSRAAMRQINMTGLGISGPSEWLVKLQDLLGGPETDAAAKREFLDRTRELRTQMAIEWTLRVLTYRLGTLERELFELWSGAGDAAKKRELIFQRWDECDEAYRVEFAGEVPEEAMSEIDRTRADVAEQARRIIETFVRRQLPRSGPNAFSKRELADMNGRRTSRQEFRPYDIQATQRTAP
ncbi:hypothetical protein SAMN02745121_05970 [Nannocystis exedens]|uniref:Uncharacterized protein n=1 Tax=Nannocystis exedens TaxID=54 RepID=A0A1I2EAR7_9BACT|nr:hypothetical protein [Nannocystis exedens]PCC74851.1 hypothetical protein NAEX_07951 [Nannocystis exedens]SFE89789.1 hypothetical protein SAMN02745121_05970 [Nannocystis exedens]